jgi:hypothetical protein
MTDQNDLHRTGHSYLGKLRSNFVGTEFQVFDDGINPRESEADEGPGGHSKWLFSFTVMDPCIKSLLLLLIFARHFDSLRNGGGHVCRERVGIQRTQKDASGDPL